MLKMMNRKSKNKNLWFAALVLFICVAITTVAVMERINLFMPDDSGAIVLAADMTYVPENETKEQEIEASEIVQYATDMEVDETTSSNSENNTKSSKDGIHGFEVSDDQQVWETNTQIEIFRISYENGEQVVTVNSGDGDKLIAPGTENSYIFKLKNTGNVALDYTVDVDAYITPEEIEIPVSARINRYDGEWIVGDNDTYVSMPEFNGTHDEEILGAGKYTYYTLDWQWPFESGNDEYDTYLGNLAAEEDITLTIEIKTKAMCSADHDNESGITAPKTGDINNVTVWSILLAGTFVIIICLLFKREEEK